MSNFSFSHSLFKRLLLQTHKNEGLVGKGLTHFHTIPHFDALKVYSCRNIVRKGEIACNKQFLLFSQHSLPYMVIIFHFKCTLKCRLQFILIWTSLKFCCLVMGQGCKSKCCSNGLPDRAQVISWQGYLKIRTLTSSCQSLVTRTIIDARFRSLPVGLWYQPQYWQICVQFFGSGLCQIVVDKVPSSSLHKEPIDVTSVFRGFF